MFARLVLITMTAVLTAAPAAADPGQDAAFFQILDRYKIGYATREDAISAAQSTCSALDRGVSFGQLETALLNHGDPASWSLRDSDQFMFAAASAYCPQYSGLVPQSSLVPR